MGVDSCVSERALREIYLKPFEIAVKDAQPASIMTARATASSRISFFMLNTLLFFKRRFTPFSAPVYYT